MLARLGWLRSLGRKMGGYGAATGPFWALLDPTSYGKSGANVTLDNALAVSTVLSCVRVLSEGIGQMPFKLYQEQDERNPVIARGHPVHRLLAKRPNEWQTPFEWREGMMIHAVLTGNAYSYKNTVGGKIVELLPLLSSKVKPVQDSVYRLTYEVTMADGSKVIFPQNSIFHLRGPSWDGYCGLDALKLAREAIGLAMTTEETHARLHSNGARPGGVLTLENGGKMGEPQLKALREEWEKTQGGVANAMKTALLVGGWKYQQLAMTGVDAQHIETRKFQIEEICRALRVFPVMVMHADRTSTFASAEQFFIAHVVHSLDPWAMRFEQSVDRDLLSTAEIDADFYSKFTRNGLLRGATRDRAQYYKDLWSVGALSPNDIRAYEDLARYDGGDEYFKPLNMGPVDAPIPDTTTNQGVAA